MSKVYTLIFLFVVGCGDGSDVTVKGEPGVKGDPGSSGQDGLAGSDGLPGEDGITTTDIRYQDMPDIDTDGVNEWTDNVTGRRWVIGSLGSQGEADAACNYDGWQVPAPADAMGAYTRGLIAVSNYISGPVTIWTSESGTIIQDAGDGTVGAASRASGDPYGIFCVESI